MVRCVRCGSRAKLASVSAVSLSALRASCCIFPFSCAWDLILVRRSEPPASVCFL